MMKPMALPASPQPKHLKNCFVWLTEKDGVFSLWKGQQHIQLRPAFFKGT